MKKYLQNKNSVYLSAGYFRLIPVCVFMLFAGFCSQANAENTAETVSLDDVSRIAVADNLGIQILRKEVDVQRHLITQEEGRYDLVAEGGLSFSKDRSPSTSVFAPSKSEQLDFYALFKQKLLSGTSLTAEWTSDRSESDSIFVTPNPSYDMNTGLSVEQPLGKNAFGIIDRAKLNQIRVDVERFKYDRLRQIEISLSEIRKVFFLAADAQKKYEIAQEGLQDAVEFDDVSKEKLRIGILELPDKLASEANVKRREISVLISRNHYRDALNRLKNELKLPLNTDLDLVLPDIEEMRIPDVPGDTFDFNHRYDWLAMQQKLEWMRLQTDIARSNLLPDADLTGSVEFSGLDRNSDEAFQDASSDRYPGYSLALSVSMPVQNRSAQAGMRQAKGRMEQAEIEADRLKRSITLQIDEAVREMTDTKSSAEIALSVLSLQQRKLDAEMRRFDQGRSGSDMIIRYQDDLLSAKESLTDRQTSCYFALDDFKLAQGSLIKMYVSGDSAGS